MLLIEDKRFYVYIYLNPLKLGNYDYPIGKRRLHFDYEPFYVGRGCNNRDKSHLNQALRILNDKNNKEKIKNNYKLNIIMKILRNNKQPIIYRLQENLTNNDVNNLEKFYIKLIGRKDLKLGPLVNLTDGGDGDSGRVFSKEHCNKISIALKQYEKTDSHCENIGKSKKGKNYFNGFTFNEYFGEEKAKEIKEKRKILGPGKTKKWSEDAKKRLEGKNSIVGNPRWVSLDILNIDMIIDLFFENYSLIKISKKLNIGKQVVKDRIRFLSIGPFNSKKEKIKFVTINYNKKQEYKDLAKKLFFKIME
jgi:hypothetical protein